MSALLTELVEYADAIIATSGDEFEKFEACEPYFRQMIEQRLYLARLHSILEENLAGRKEITPDMSAGNFLVLHGSRHSSWAVLKHVRQTRQLYLTPSHSISAMVGGGPLRLDRYAVPADVELSELDTTKELKLLEGGAMQIGEIVSKNGRAHSLDIYPSEATSAYTVRVNTIPYAPFEWAFSRETLRPIKMSSLRAADSNLTTIFDLLSAVASPQSVEWLAPYAQHELHFVRWHAVNAVGTIDPKFGLELAERAVADPHPHVRAAARTTLDTVAARQ